MIFKKDQENLITEEKILKLLNEDKESMVKFKNMWEEEYELLERKAPYILDSWQYYKKFKQMQEQLIKEKI